MYKEIFKDFSNISFETKQENEIVVKITPEDLLAVVEKLKKSGFDILNSISGTDYIDYIELDYFFYSITNSKKLILKTQIVNEMIDSITTIFKSADWFEREIFDLLGINFLNHPDLKRILLPNSWQGYPLRKNYKNNDERLVWNE